MVSLSAILLNALSVGMFVLLGAFGTLLLVHFADRCCSINIRDNILEDQENITGGRIATAAGLAGMTVKERRSVLEKIIIRKVLSLKVPEEYNEEDTNVNNKTERKTSMSEKTEDTLSSLENGEETLSVTSIEGNSGDDEMEKNANDQKSNIIYLSKKDLEVDTLNQCVICLEDYEDGQNVVVGKNCRHMFHETCIMEWLEKKDVCPFCRKDMFTVKEFKKAAILTLDKDRIQTLVTKYGQERMYNADPDLVNGEGSP